MVRSGVVRELRRPLILASVFLLAATFFAYAGVVDNEFVGYDDGVYVSDNENVLGGLTAPGIRWAFTTGYAGNWHPLTWISHMLDVDLFGVDPGAMARTNVVLHGITSVLLLVFVARVTGAFWPSVLIALVFSLHPLRVESVAWIAERKDVLSGLFFMTTLLAWLHYVRKPGVGTYTIVIVSLAWGLMSKPVLVTLPCVLLLLDFWPLQRVRFEVGVGASLARLVLEKIPLFLLAIVSSLVTMQVQAAGGAIRPEALSPLDHRIANALTSYLAYLGKIVWPSDLACFYPLPTFIGDVSPWTLPVFASAAFVIGVSVLAWRERRRRPWLGVGWLWFLGMLVPMIGLVQVGNQSMADRYTYLPAIGLSLWVVGGLMELGEPRARTLSISLGTIVLVVFSLATRRQVEVWSNGTVLFEHALAVTENNSLAHFNLGTRLLRGTPARIADARPHLEAAVRIDPRHAGARLNLGAVYWLEDRPDQATVYFEHAVRLDPSNAEAHLSLGAARFEQGRIAEAIEHFEIAISLDPENASARSNLGSVYLSMDRFAEAVRSFERALSLEPGMQQASDGLREASLRLESSR
jgi:Flp pilus assembly protein TadD